MRSFMRDYCTASWNLEWIQEQLKHVLLSNLYCQTPFFEIINGSCTNFKSTTCLSNICRGPDTSQWVSALLCRGRASIKRNGRQQGERPVWHAWGPKRTHLVKKSSCDLMIASFTESFRFSSASPLSPWTSLTIHRLTPDSLYASVCHLFPASRTFI